MEEAFWGMNSAETSGLIGRSAAFVRAVGLIRRFAKTGAPVLIEGETGTGKEVAARAVHYAGVRSDGPFVPVNCGALPDSLIENELFGHARGAYTDARSSQLGLIPLANGGTLFLDEVEALCPKGQVALLRFLQDLSYRPLGSRHEERADVRIIAATNVPLLELTNAGRFRTDLYYRLEVLSLRMPALRERPGDTMLLAKHFTQRFSMQYGTAAKEISQKTTLLLEAHTWPGNVRELENVIHRAHLLSDGNELTVPRHWLAATEVCAATQDETGDYLRLAFAEAKAHAITRFEREYIAFAMSQSRGNVSQAARCCGKERRAFGKLLKKHGIDKSDFTH